MEQHLIPQQISSYEFRLVGDMTLKQFAQIAGGFLISLLIYATPLPGYLKWPLILIFGSLGAAMAFIPIEERPLQTWIFAFIKASYSPTQFTWKKEPKIPELFAEQTRFIPLPLVLKAPIGDQRKLAEYLSTLSKTDNLLDQEEENSLMQIQKLFSSLYVPPPASNLPLPQTHITATRLTSLPSEQEDSEFKRQAAAVALEDKPIPPIFSPYTPTLSSGYYQGAKELKNVRFGNIPMPLIPEIPNILVGMIFDTVGKIVDGAILEIRDSHGNPVRALRTNKLGQFRIATPLPNDNFEIEVEKEGLSFDTLKIILKGEIVQPIEIRARGRG